LPERLWNWWSQASRKWARKPLRRLERRERGTSRAPARRIALKDPRGWQSQLFAEAPVAWDFAAVRPREFTNGSVLAFLSPAGQTAGGILLVGRYRNEGSNAFPRPCERRHLRNGEHCLCVAARLRFCEYEIRHRAVGVPRSMRWSTWTWGNGNVMRDAVNVKRKERIVMTIRLGERRGRADQASRKRSAGARRCHPAVVFECARNAAARSMCRSGGCVARQAGGTWDRRTLGFLERRFDGKVSASTLRQPACHHPRGRAISALPKNAAMSSLKNQSATSRWSSESMARPERGCGSVAIRRVLAFASTGGGRSRRRPDGKVRTGEGANKARQLRTEARQTRRF